MHRIGYTDFNHYFQVSKCNFQDGITKYSNALNYDSIKLINEYYKPKSLKALNCRSGIDLLKKFCSDHDVDYEICGKIIIASDKKIIKIDASASVSFAIDEDYNMYAWGDNDLGTLGIGTASPGDFGIDNATHGVLKADFDGSIHVDRNIYDSQGSPGVNGYYLQRDGNGIRWNQVSPVDLDGIRVQENGVDLPIGGCLLYTSDAADE